MMSHHSLPSSPGSYPFRKLRISYPSNTAILFSFFAMLVKSLSRKNSTENYITQVFADSL